MNRRIVQTTALAALVATSLLGEGPSAGATLDRVPAIGATPVVTGLNYPSAFAIAPDGRFFYGEQYTGKIMIYDPDTKKKSLFYRVTNISTEGEHGLLGLAIHWNYPTRPWIHAYATRLEGGTPYNEILHIIDEGGTGRLKKVIWKSDVASQGYHDGGRILWEDGGRLLAIQGDALDPGNAQHLGRDAGKVLRMTGGGGIPDDNPIAGSLVYAYGLRNSFGFDIDEETGLVWESENGPACNDEINLIEPGENYGWGPSQTCSTPPAPPANTNRDGPSPTLPVKYWGNVIAPTGIAFCFGCHISGSDGAMFYGAYNDRGIRRAYLNDDRDDITRSLIVYTHGSPVLSLETGPNGNIHFSTSSAIWKLTN